MENVSEGWGRTAWGRDVDEELGEPPARRPAWATQSVGSGPTTRVLPQLSRVPYTTTRGSHQPQAQGARGTSPPARTEGARPCPRRGAVRRGASHQHSPVGLQPGTHAGAFSGAVCLPRQPRATHTPAPAQAHAARAPWGHPEWVEMLTHAPAPAKPPRHPLQHLPPRSALTHGPTRALLSHAPPCTHMPLHTHTCHPHRGRAGCSVLCAPPCLAPLRLPWVPHCGSGAAFGHRLPAAAVALGLYLLTWGRRLLPRLCPRPRACPRLSAGLRRRHRPRGLEQARCQSSNKGPEQPVPVSLVLLGGEAWVCEVRGVWEVGMGPGLWGWAADRVETEVMGGGPMRLAAHTALKRAP